MNVNWKNGRTARSGATSPDGATRLGRCPASGLSVVCWDWPGAYPQTEKSVLFLLSATHRRSNLDAGCQPHGAAGHARASATSPSLVLIMLWITSFLVLARIVSTSRFRVKKKMKREHN
jgi:hypothetical protein